MAAETAPDMNARSVNYTFVEWVDRWITNTAFAAEETTVAQYRHCLDRYIRPFFQGLSMQDVDENTIQLFFNRLGPDEKQLSAQTIHLVRCVINQAMSFAVSSQLLLYNPVELTYILNRTYNRRELLRKELIDKILRKDFHHAYENFFPLLLLTSMRYGECAGLSWDDIDLEKRTLTVRQQLVEYRQDAHLVRIIKPHPKNHRSRKILLSEAACRYLKDQKELQSYQRQKNKTVWNNPHNLVFTDPDGSMLKHYKVTRRFKMLAAACGMPKATIHTLRHTGCSILYYATKDVSLLREYAGHSSDGAAYYYIHALDTLRGALQQ